MYDLFMRKWNERMEDEVSVDVHLKPEQIRAQEEIAARIAEEIAGEIAQKKERQS